MPWWVTLTGVLALTAGMIGGIVHVFRSTEHNWRECQCWDCRAKVYRVRKRRGDRVIGMDQSGHPIWTQAPISSFNFLSTEDLTPNMIVEVNGIGYLVRKTVRRMDGGYMVHLMDIRAQRSLIVDVEARNASRRFWEPGYGGKTTW